jgi:hypothetical protein
MGRVEPCVPWLPAPLRALDRGVLRPPSGLRGRLGSPAAPRARAAEEAVERVRRRAVAALCRSTTAAARRFEARRGAHRGGARPSRRGLAATPRCLLGVEAFERRWGGSGTCARGCMAGRRPSRLPPGLVGRPRSGARGNARGRRPGRGDLRLGGRALSGLRASATPGGCREQQRGEEQGQAPAQRRACRGSVHVLRGLWRPTPRSRPPESASIS